MTRQKELERRRLQADKLASLGRLSAGLAHEINNPLGLVLGYTQLMLKEAQPGDRFHEDLKMVEKHARSCKKIVEDLLKFSRSAETKKTPANLNDLVNEALSAVRPRFGNKAVFVVKKLAPVLPRIRVDPEKIKQVLVNILINAEQAMEGEGTITVATGYEPAARQVVVSFKDTGVGISPGIIDNIFDPFFTTRPTGKGTGLGLAVSYGILRDHEGEIRVESAPGKGSLFTVLLPLEVTGDRTK